MRRLISKLLTILCIAFVGGVLVRTAPAQLNLSGAEEIKLALDKLNVLGTVLMIAAHPDDENTAVLAYYARGRKVETGYLSATRGEGGQNLIGSEQGDLLGLIRTQELLGARRIDGAQQFFTRAIDFGFTKTVDETMEKWGHDTILSDMVWVIREFKPDVIILRFSGTPKDGHGQHQSSSLLGKEAFSAASDPRRFPEQLKWVQPWQAKRMLWNTFAFTPEQEKEAASMPGRIEIDSGKYDPLLGKSYAEIAGISRSEHKTQGMGAPQRRGTVRDYFVTIAGDKPVNDIFDGMDITWKRVPGGAEIGRQLADAAARYEIEHPERTVARLLAVRPAISRLAASGNIWGERKLRELDEAAVLCSGLWVDAQASQATQTPGGRWKITLTAVDRSPIAIGPVSARVEGLGKPVTANIAASLEYNKPASKDVEVTVPVDEPYSQPFWLAHKHKGETYAIDDQRLIGRPDPIPVLQATFNVKISGEELTLVKPVRYRYIDRVEGEKTQPIVVAPPVALNLIEPAVVFPNASAKHVDILLRAEAAKTSGTLRIEAADGWKIAPESVPFELGAAGDEQQFSFSVTPPAKAPGGGGAPTRFRAVATVNGKEIESGVQVISYSHIPPQTVFPRSDGKLANAPLTVLAKRVGYIAGAGDQVADAIRQMGCDVTFLSDQDLAGGDLSSYDAIVVGVRGYNVRDALRANQQRLMKYVEQGGTMIVQYNVAGGRTGGTLENIGPYPITLSQDRVTVEDSNVTFLDAASTVLNQPNKITEADFAGWVQERGLYFASKWDTKYQTLIECHDPGEKPMPGGMLLARYGKGVYIFTGYSWFRQLPAGVPGAYRIFANLLSAGKAR
jgi:LmbE family N-acetylglucosaminyl deacetylase